MKFTKLFCASLLTFSASSALADPAAVIDDFSCIGFVPETDPQVFLVSTESHKVITSKDSRLLSCHFDHDVELANPVAATGFLCGVFLADGSDKVLTSDTKMLAAPGGRAMLTCKVKN